MAFKRYTAEEIAQAALSAGVDPFVLDAIYAKESSRGTNPAAMRVRSVKQPESGKSVLILGPLQMSGDTFRATAAKHNLPTNYDDPQVYLKVAAAHAADLSKAVGGDPSMIFAAWKGGLGAVNRPNAKDETGETVKQYADSAMAEANRNRARASGKAQPQGPAVLADNTPVRALQNLDSLSPSQLLTGGDAPTPDLQTLAETTPPQRIAAPTPAVQRDSLGLPLLLGNLGMPSDMPAMPSPIEPTAEHYAIANYGGGGQADYDAPTLDDEAIERIVDEEYSKRFPNA